MTCDASVLMTELLLLLTLADTHQLGIIRDTQNRSMPLALPQMGTCPEMPRLPAGPTATLKTKPTSPPSSMSSLYLHDMTAQWEGMRHP